MGWHLEKGIFTKSLHCLEFDQVQEILCSGSMLSRLHGIKDYRLAVYSCTVLWIK